jgi:hypothetical protein
MTFTASATAQGIAYTNNYSMVTATASAMGVSEVSYQDALDQATNLAQQDANVTAQYDVNLINQAVTEATTVATQNIDYNTKQVNSAPDRTFYYTCDTNDIIYTKTVLGETNEAQSLLSTYNGHIFRDSDLTVSIGKWTANGTIFNIDQTESEFFQRTGIYNLYLPDGNLNFCINANVKKYNGNFVLEPNTYYHTIVAGTGKFLGATGLIAIQTNSENLKRFVNVYLN